MYPPGNPNVNPKYHVFFDELFYGFATSTKDQELGKQLLRLIELRDKGWVKVNYVVNNNGPQSFVESAAQNGAGSINLYVGHGRGKDGKEEEVDPVKLEKIKTEINKQMKTKDGELKWKATDPSVVKAGGVPKFAFSSCFGGAYNEELPTGYRATGAMTDKGKIGTYINHPGLLAKQLKAMIDELEAARDARKLVTLYLYFGDDGGDRATHKAAAAKLIPKEGTYLFSTWKKEDFKWVK